MFAVACNSVALANPNDCFVERILWYYLANISKYFSMDFVLTTLKLVVIQCDNTIFMHTSYWEY